MVYTGGWIYSSGHHTIEMITQWEEHEVNEELIL